MAEAFGLLVPVILCASALCGLRRRVDVFAAMTKGAGEGLTVLARIFPSLVVLLTAVSMLRASQAPEVLGRLLSPLFSFLGIPNECAPLLLTRPVSAGASLAVASDLMRAYGPDSTVGRTAAVMLSSGETTFFTVAVYYGSCGVTKGRYTVPAALCADVAMFLASAWTVRLFFP